MPLTHITELGGGRSDRIGFFLVPWNSQKKKQKKKKKNGRFVRIEPDRKQILPYVHPGY